MLLSLLHSQHVFCTFVSVCESRKRAFCGGECFVISVFLISSSQTKMSTSPLIRSKKLGMGTPQWVEHVKERAAGFSPVQIRYFLVPFDYMGVQPPWCKSHLMLTVHSSCSYRRKVIVPLPVVTFVMLTPMVMYPHHRAFNFFLFTLAYPRLELFDF